MTITTPRHRASTTVVTAYFTDGGRQEFTTTRPHVHLNTATPGLIEIRYHADGPFPHADVLAVLNVHGLRWLDIARAPEASR